MVAQNDWRFCTKCYSLFRYGYREGGVCAAGGSHSPFQSCSPTNAPTSWEFALQITSTAPPARRPGANPAWGPAGTQNNWRFCTKCYVLFFYGLYGFAGVCPQGGEHSPLASASLENAGTSWDFALRIVADPGRRLRPGPIRSPDQWACSTTGGSAQSAMPFSSTGSTASRACVPAADSTAAVLTGTARLTPRPVTISPCRSPRRPRRGPRGRSQGRPCRRNRRKGVVRPGRRSRFHAEGKGRDQLRDQRRPDQSGQRLPSGANHGHRRRMRRIRD